jgi:methionine aminopeptidase
MSITSLEQFEKLRACGTIVGKARRAIAAAVRPAITTAELCEIASRVLAKHGARLCSRKHRWRRAALLLVTPKTPPAV